MAAIDADFIERYAVAPSNLLAGRNALLTGASSGIGEHLASAVAAAGPRVILGARRTERVEILASELRELGSDALAVRLDVTDEASIIDAFDAAEKAFGGQ